MNFQTLRQPLLRILMLAPLLALGVAGNASAMLIGLSSTNPGVLYDISTTTGAASVRTPIDKLASFTGISFLGGELYATDIFDSTFNLYKVDINTGVTTFVHSQDSSANWHGLASDEGAGLLYSIDLNDANKLKTTDTSGTITTIGTGTGIQGRGMAHDDGAGVLYATGPASGVQSLYTVDKVFGTSSLVGSTGIDSFFVGLAYDETADILYMLADPDNAGPGFANLYTLDVLTGLASLIGSTGFDRIDGLAWAPVPEPGTLALLGLGLAGLGAVGRRRRSVNAATA